MAVLVLAQAALGLVMARLPDSAIKFDLYQWHKSDGLVILGLALLRIAWRLADPAPPLPAGMPRWERRAARANHLLLYLALILIPVTGLALVSASPLEVPTLAFGLVYVPPLPLPRDEALEATLIALHGALAFAALALVGVHVAAALRHHFVLRDGLLGRMMRPRE